MATSLTDIHPDIIQTHILNRLDGPSLSTTAATSSYLNALCSDHTLWSPISRSTWPSITHPHVDYIISTFPAGHRSFFHDSFPTLTTHCSRSRFWPSFKSYYPSELISAVDIRYQNSVVYSTVKFTETRPEFLSTPFCIELNEPKWAHDMSRSIDLTVDEIAGPGEETLSHVKDSMTLSWIIVDPVRKRACNLSSVKPVRARADWATNDTHIRYVTVLAGCDPNEMVQCNIRLTLGAGEKGVGLKVKQVALRLKYLDSFLNGKEFLRLIEGIIMEENNVIRKVVNDDERLKSYLEFKKMKRERKEWIKRNQRFREVAIDFSFVVVPLFYFALIISLFYTILYYCLPV